MEASRKHVSQEKASKRSAERKQNQSKTVAVCPFLDSVIGREITCTEGVPIKGTQARSTFATKKQREAYTNLYCYGEYRSCPLLQAVLCPYNEGVECREKNHCDQCGWNPKVGSVRLEKWKEKQFAGDGSEKANKGQTKR